MFLSFFFSSRRRHTRFDCDWSSDVCSSDLATADPVAVAVLESQARISGGTTPYQAGNIGSFGGALSAPNGLTPGVQLDFGPVTDSAVKNQARCAYVQSANNPARFGKPAAPHSTQ